MKATILKGLKVGKNLISTSEDISKLCLTKGRKNVCPHINYANCIPIKAENLSTETGIIKWICEDGTLISEQGYHYSISAFV